jgi:tetratricopeptide (TPR) repeat protein
MLAVLEDARNAVQAANDKLALAILEMAEGRFTYWKALDKTNDWGPPIEDFDRALKIYKELGDQVGLGEAMFYRGLVYQMQEQNLHAREMFVQALGFTEQTGDERMRSFVVRHIGYLQQTAGEIDAARANFQKSLQLRQRNDMKVFVPFALLALAEFEAEQKNLGEAVRLDEQAIPLAESGNSPRALYSAQLTLAKWYADEGKTAKAKELAEQSSRSRRLWQYPRCKGSGGFSASAWLGRKCGLRNTDNGLLISRATTRERNELRSTIAMQRAPPSILPCGTDALKEG